MTSVDTTCFAEIICNKSPNCVEFFHQRDPGPVLLAYTWESCVTICVLHFPQLEAEVEEFAYENLTDIDHGPSVLKVSWSPKTSMLVHPVGIIFCTIGLDFQLRLFTVNNKMEVEVKTIGEHSSFINDCAFEPIQGDVIATVGDDRKCRVWKVDSDEELVCIPLTSPGKSVKWNPSDPGKLLVAEQNSCIRMYDTGEYQPLFTLHCLKPSLGLAACDWSVTNSLKVGAVIGKEWHVWDLAKGSLPESSGQAHSGFGQEFRWSIITDTIFATRGRPDNQVKLYCLHDNKMPVSIKTKVGHGLSWHNLLPIYAIGGNRKISLFDLELMR